MTTARAVRERNQKFGIEELGMRCDDTEFPEFWQVQRADSYWVAVEGTYVDHVSGVGYQAFGTTAIAVLGSRVAVIVSPEDPSSPATWITFDTAEARSTGIGQTGLLRKRPESVEIALDGAILHLKHISKVFRSSGQFKANQEAALMQLLA